MSFEGEFPELAAFSFTFADKPSLIPILEQDTEISYKNIKSIPMIAAQLHSPTADKSPVSELEIVPSDVGNNIMSEDVFVEPLLRANATRHTLFPIKYPDIYESYKIQQACFWTAEELDFGQDREDWNKLKPEERHFLSHVLAFFAGSDGIVMENIAVNFSEEVQYQEAQLAYNYQTMMEGIHSEVYSQLIETLVTDPAEKSRLFSAILTIPCIEKKARWAKKWMNTAAPFAMRLVAFAFVEGIFFSGSFCSIYWIKQRGILPGLTSSNEFIARDEGQHTDFAILLYKNHIVRKIPEATIHDLAREAVEIETEFICESLPCDLLGMNKRLMAEYIQYVADRLLVQLGYNKIWNSKNPFPFMERISVESKENFFEKRVTNYQRAATSMKITDDDSKFSMDADF